VPEFHAKAPQATASEGLAQGPYVVARAGIKPATLHTKGVESTNEPPQPTICIAYPCKIYIKYTNKQSLGRKGVRMAFPLKKALLIDVLCN